MMPPVSLPFNGGTVSARTGTQASIANTAPSITLRIIDSLRYRTSIEGGGGDEKNGRLVEAGLSPRCCRLALDPTWASRHRPRPAPLHGLPMRDLFSAFRRLSLVAVFGLLALGQAHAANPLEKNFWLSGPRYDGN